MKFLRLTRFNGNLVFINVNHIELIAPTKEGSVIRTVRSDTSVIDVQEDADFILQMIRDNIFNKVEGAI